MRTKSKRTPGPGVRVPGITLQDEGNWVVSAAAKPIGVCPDCGTRSRYRHGWHNRSLQDLPVQGQVVKIKLTLNRWQCRQLKCRRRTFVDRCPRLLYPTRAEQQGWMIFPQKSALRNRFVIPIPAM
ncbi:transposase family protein [Phyllobacterium brassicacearum]|uniref:transposase family protein n=1 Tax=Phyllobacterium brassicacearum TaxID=314235 RepID=UPI001FDFBB3B|nr:transposase family protein [Phyllobacterium brassicacearum]